MDQRSVTANGLEFAYLDEGPPDGPLALCLHGFPDSAHTWRYLLPELGRAGFHAVAPFMRGYAPTAIPADGLYQVGALARDANALHQALGAGSDAVIIGHDWGAPIAAHSALLRPDIFTAVAMLSVPYSPPGRRRPTVTAAVAPTGSIMSSFFTYSQLQRSWYTFFFQSPLADLALPMDDFVFLDRLWADWSPGYDASYDLARVKESIGDGEHIAAAIGYYRALYDASGHSPDLADEQAAAMLPSPIPTLYLHGRDDGCFALEAIGNPLDFLAQGSEVVVVDDAGHFLNVEQPELFNRHVLDFIAP